METLFLKILMIIVLKKHILISKKKNLKFMIKKIILKRKGVQLETELFYISNNICCVLLFRTI